MSSKYIGSELIISDENIQKIVSGLVNKTSKIIDESDDYIEIHNAYSAYSVMLLLSATGHRPVHDPFCYSADYCLDLGLMLVEDKVVSERHRYRLVALPEIAVTQLVYYEKHLKWVASKLIVDPASNELEHAVHQVLNRKIKRKKHTLPLFFFLEKNKNNIKTLSFSESLLKKYWGELWPIPYNFGRHNIASQLRRMRNIQVNSNLSIEAIEAQLGHMEGQKHPFGSSSVLSPLAFQQQIAVPLHELLIKQQWKALATKRQFKNLDNLHQINWKHSKLPLGPFDRENKRRLQQIDDDIIVTSALEKHSLDTLISNPSIIDTIRKDIIKKSDSNEDRINMRLILLWKKLIVLKSKNPKFKLPRRIHIIGSDPSPFSVKSIDNFKKSINLRQAFISYLELKGKSLTNKKITYYRRVSEILISCAMFDGICNKELLEKLSLSKLRLTQESDIRYMDIVHVDDKKKNNLLWRWLPQPLSIALIDGLDRELVSNSRMKNFNQSRFLTEFIKLLSDLGITEVDAKNAYSELASLSESFWLMHTPPFLHAIATGSTPVQPLAESTFVRILREERLNYSPPDEAPSENEERTSAISYAFMVNESSHHITNAKTFLLDLKEHLNTAEKETGKNKKSANYTRKETLHDLLHNRLLSNHKYPSIGVAVASWCIKLCTKGTDHYGSIAFSTVKGYTSMVANALLEISFKTNFFTLDPEQYDYIYDIAIEINKHEDQTQLLNNLKDFHHFLVSAGLVPEIDWGYISQTVYANRIVSRVDANIISSTEYLAALEIIFKAGEKSQLEKRLSMQYCALLILGYHFGLRFSEAFHLQYRHIQHNDNWTFIIVHASNTLFGDTKSSAGRRQIPLIDNLTKREWSIIQIVFDSQVTTHRDEQSSIFSLGNETRVLINKSRASQILNNVLKQVTGDPHSHYHLLRHSFDSRIYPQFYDIDESSLDRFIKKLSNPYLIEPSALRVLMTGRDNLTSKSLSALSIATGHAQIPTTFSHYIHTADHHLHYNASQIPLWNCFRFGRIDHITAYAHLLSHETTKKRRDRNCVKTDDLIGAFSSTIQQIRFPASTIETLHHPNDASLIMVVTTENNDFSLVNIDKILLLFCALDGLDVAAIADRLYLEHDLVKKILDKFQGLKNQIDYLGYNRKCDIKGETSSEVDIESSAETIAMHDILPVIDEKIKGFDKNGLASLFSGIESWERAYYPNRRYRPLVFFTPIDVLNFLNAMSLLGIHASDMMTTSDKQKGTWYELTEKPAKLIVCMDNESTQFKFNCANVVTHIPLPLCRKRVSRKERISISLHKKNESFIAYQKRLHRLCFLLRIYLK